MDRKEFITFNGLDFNEVQKLKKDYVYVGDLENILGDAGFSIREDIAYFGIFNDHLADMFFPNSGVLSDEEIDTLYLCYRHFCIELDREVYRLMYLDDTETKGFYEFIGFHPGCLFGETVDGGNLETFNYLYKNWYRLYHGTTRKYFDE